MSNNRIDNIMHKNTYNTEVNKKLNLQEDIEKLEEQKTILRDMVKAVSEENDSLQEKHEELLMKQAVGYDGWEEDLAGFEKELDNIVLTFDNLYDRKCMYNQFTEYEAMWEDIKEVNRCASLLQDLCLKYPRISISSEELIDRGGRFRRSLDRAVEKLNGKLEEVNKLEKKLDCQITQAEELKENYRERLSEERKTGMWYFLGGCLVATVITLMLK